GSWHYQGHVWLNLTIWRPNRLEAMLSCIQHLQVAAYDYAQAVTLPDDRRWQAVFHVLSDDRQTILPQCLTELAEHGISPKRAYRLLWAARDKWLRDETPTCHTARS